MLQQVLWEKKKELERFALKVKKLSLKVAIFIAADDTFLAFLDVYGVTENVFSCAYRLTFAADGQFVSFGLFKIRTFC